MAERERRDHEAMRMSMGTPHAARSPFGPPTGFPPTSMSGGPPGHPPTPHSQPPPGSAPSLFGSEGRRLEEIAARASAERQYVERINALATDPLVRLQMAGVNPEIPGASHSQMMSALAAGIPGLHPAYAASLLGGPLGGPGAGLRPPPPGPLPPGLDPRFRPPGPAPADLAAALRSVHPGALGAGLPPNSQAASLELLQRQLLMERDPARSVHDASLFAAQQEELRRLQNSRP